MLFHSSSMVFFRYRFSPMEVCSYLTKKYLKLTSIYDLGLDGGFDTTGVGTGLLNFENGFQ